MAMDLPLDSMAASIGVSVPVLRFLLCFVATIPLSFLCRVLPRGLPKHLYSAVVGIVLSYLSFGFSSNLHFLAPMLLGYAAMLLYRPRCGIITFFTGFGYLIGCHVYYMSGDAWKEGGIDATGALMVLTLKVISCAINYNDGLLKEEGLIEAQKTYRLIKMPSLIEYVGYCLCCGSHFAGPVYEMKDYLDWTEGKGIWSSEAKGPSPSPYGATARALLQAGFCMAMYLKLSPHFSLSMFTDPTYQEWGFWKKLGYQYMSGFSARWKYYFIWSISEASIIISGLGFSGWTDSSPPKPRWDRAKNVDVLGVEFATSAVVIPTVWNIQVSTWLRHYVYERLIQNGKKPGFFQLLATQTVSAVWHGLYPGYIIFFVQSALMIAGSKVIYKWQQAMPPTMALVKNVLVFMNFAYTLLVLNYSCVGFMVLSLHETLASYGSVYYIGTIVPVVIILLGHIIKPAKPVRSKARKEQ
ncbi:lysophospholipid acyltransferase 1-like isoform X1 [Abrus precatorius]|uniref:Lysophospholipid acyltransferase 1-like isoform X1 n=1 Tax=Abrus precatorius TaxID=3816 RepID=A0A8B8JTJ0_ABRPR|nr:lysophospholipid acyltransferase 1-like isoform X1 [Abrus precatorius]